MGGKRVHVNCVLLNKVKCEKCYKALMVALKYNEGLYVIIATKNCKHPCFFEKYFINIRLISNPKCVNMLLKNKIKT